MPIDYQRFVKKDDVIIVQQILPIFVLYMTRFQIQPEEQIMARKFDKTYQDYVSRVRRWI